MAKDKPEKNKRRNKLFKLSGQLALKSLSGVLTARSKAQTRIEQAKLLTDALSEMKGAAMKAGQLLSIDSSDLLPKEAIQILSNLQNNAEAHPFSEINEILKTELGDRYNDLSQINEVPVAAASIGQVHKASYKDKPLALKVQYNGVADSIDEDIATLKKVIETFLKVTARSIPVDESFEELRKVLEKEVNYLNELKNIQRYKELSSNHSEYIIPKAYPEYSTQKVLAMEYVDGISFQEWLDGKPSLDDRTQMAHYLLRLFCLEFVDWGFVQTDPNFGNYLIQKEPMTLVCLDFGATLEYSDVFRKQYAQLLMGMKSANTTQLFNLALDFNLLSEKEDRETQIAFKEMIQVALEPFSDKLQPFDFQNKDFAQRTVAANLRFSRRLKHSPPPHHILFLHRKLGGIFNLVKRLDVKIDLLPYWQEMTKLADCELQ